MKREDKTKSIVAGLLGNEIIEEVSTSTFKTDSDSDEDRLSARSGRPAVGKQLNSF